MATRSPDPGSRISRASAAAGSSWGSNRGEPRRELKASCLLQDFVRVCYWQPMSTRWLVSWRRLDLLHLLLVQVASLHRREAEKWLLEAQEIFEDLGERRLRGAQKVLE